jgi:hypothetical protein
MRRYLCAGLVSIEMHDQPSWLNSFYELGEGYEKWIELAVGLTARTFDNHYEGAPATSETLG